MENTKKKTGRPPKPPGQRIRSIPVYITETEREAIEKVYGTMTLAVKALYARITSGYDHQASDTNNRI